MDVMEAVILSTPDKKAKYDAVLKQLIANKQILARIMKRFVPEFENCSLKDIEEKYILSGEISVSKVGVQKNTTNQMVESIGTEDKSNNEGNITYDIMFMAEYPGEQGKLIKLYINLEIQNKYHPGYPLEKRGIFYASRRLCSQLLKIDKNTDYGQLLKVYSIWLCMGDDVSDENAETVTSYGFEKKDVIGEVNVPRENYDLMDIIIIRINDEAEIEDETLRLLQTLCSNRLEKREKIEKIKQFGICSNEMEGGIDEMCNLSESIFRGGRQEGRQEGTILANIRTICNMKKDGMPSPNIAKYVETENVDAVIDAAEGNFSTDDVNVNRIYKKLCATNV